MRRLTYLLTFGVMAGCGEPGIVETPATEAPVVAGPRDYPITSRHSAFSVSARAGAADASTATLSTTGGNVSLDDGVLIALDVALADVVLSERFTLTEIRVALVDFAPDPGSLRSTDSTLTGIASLRLDWTLETASGAHQLQGQTVTGVDLVVDLAGRSDVLVDLHRAGTFWRWAGLYELGDLDATLHGTEQTVR